MKKVKSTSFINNKGTVIFEDGSIQEMTYDEYIIMKRNFNPQSISKLIRYLQKKGAFYYGGHHRTLNQVHTKQNFQFFRGKNLLTRDEYEKVVKLLARYQRLYHYIKEISPQWTKVCSIYQADNSIDEIQINKHGKERKVMIVAPHGDACY